VRYVPGQRTQAGDQLRVSAQLLDAGGVQVWSESFDRQCATLPRSSRKSLARSRNTVASQVVPETDVRS
jgi:TolB-like protein